MHIIDPDNCILFPSNIIIRLNYRKLKPLLLISICIMGRVSLFLSAGHVFTIAKKKKVLVSIMYPLHPLQGF